MVLANGTSMGGYVHGMSCISMIDPGEIGNNHNNKDNKDERFLVEKSVKKNEESKVVRWNTCSSSSATSSIGKNSDVSGKSKENYGDIDEVQSPYKGPLDAMEALEEVLPMRRGISSFYNGKSKSFACLAEEAAASSSTSSIKGLAKPENAYIRRRRNLLASSSLVLDNKNRTSLLRSNGGGVSKRVNSNRSTLALAVTMDSSPAKGKNESDNALAHYPTALSGGSPSSILRARIIHSQFRDYFQSNGPSSSSSSLPPRKHFSAWRSLSYADLQHCVSISASACTAPTPTQSDTDGCHT